MKTASSFPSATIVAVAAAAALLTPLVYAFRMPPEPFINPWQAFMNLSTCMPGDHNPGLPSLKQYFHQFGYLPSNFLNFSDAFDESLQTAIRTYQDNFRLPPTGLLDNTTLNQISSPRCGVPDIINGSSTMSAAHKHGRNLYTYFPGRPTWDPTKRVLTYTFASTAAVSINISTLREVFSRSFSRWAEATTLSFTETDSIGDADIRIGFFSGDHGDGEPFDGVLGTLAHAFSPSDGRFHLDAAESWVATGDVADSNSNTAIDLESVVTHEIGHLLGLGHTSVEEAIMYPTIRTQTKKVELTKDDVDGIQSLYGSNPGYEAPPTTARETNGVGEGRGVGGSVGILFQLSTTALVLLGLLLF